MNFEVVKRSEKARVNGSSRHEALVAAMVANIGTDNAVYVEGATVSTQATLYALLARRGYRLRSVRLDGGYQFWVEHKAVA